jgi:hypothetical protein
MNPPNYCTFQFIYEAYYTLDSPSFTEIVRACPGMVNYDGELHPENSQFNRY